MKQNILTRIFILTLILAPSFSLAAKDFGLILDQSASYDDTEDLKYYGTLIPWFSAPVGASAGFYFSAGGTVSYEKEEWKIIPELLRTEFAMRIKENGVITIGRMLYADPVGFIANGLFDGVRYSGDMGENSTLGLGAWYTGFLYKKNAHITMTNVELADQDEPVEYDAFFDTYFAPKRLVAAIDWEHSGIKELVRMNLALIGQFDLSGNDTLFHTQYIAAKASVPLNNFIFDLGLCAEFAEMGDRFETAFAGTLGFGWFLPTQVNDRLSFTAHVSSGTINDNITAFVPITTVSQGSVLKAKLSGLSMLCLDYTARFHQSFSLSLQSSYFILSDKGSFMGPPAGKDGYFLGNEFYGAAIWTPFSDIQVKLGGGAFLPSLGNADSEADIIWRVDLNVVLVLL